MALDFGWSALFKGIGDTFTAGAAVNTAQIQRGLAKLGFQDNREQRIFQTDEDRLAYLLDGEAQDAQIIKWVIIGAIAIVALIIIFRK